MSQRLVRLTTVAGSALRHPATGACLLGAVTACAGFPGHNGAGSASRQLPVELDGLPSGLDAKAKAVLETDDAAPRSVLESRRKAAASADTLEEFLASEGYLAANVSPELIESVDKKPRLDVSAGDMFHVATVTLTLDADVSGTLMASLEDDSKSLATGAPASLSARFARAATRSPKAAGSTYWLRARTRRSS